MAGFTAAAFSIGISDNASRTQAAAKVLVAQLGSRQDYTVPLALQNAGVLERLYTDMYLSPAEAMLVRSLIKIKLPGSLAASALSRHNRSLNYSRVRRFSALGLSYLMSLRRAATIEDQYRLFSDYGSRFNREMLRDSLPDATHIYAFDHAALELFQTPYAIGKKRILDQIYPALYEEKIEQEEEDRWPDWPTARRRSFYESSFFRRWRDTQIEEWSLADTVIVASEYSKKSVALVHPEVEPKLKVVPLTVSVDKYLPLQHSRRCAADRPLRVLFAGSVNLRKGIPYLLDAFDQIDARDAKLTVVGGIQIRPEKVAIYQDRVDFRGAIPHSEMPRLYHDADVFVFPTISDGFGAVMLEAMAAGLPVISTSNCGDIVVDGVNGYKIPERDPNAIVERVYGMIRRPELLENLSAGAITTSQKYSIVSYQAKLCQALDVSSTAAHR